jgi:signal transduction histidine kinase
MNVTLAQELSIYKLVVNSETAPQPLQLCPATLLAMMRSQIDLLISEQIAATLWVKLPAGNIWQSEINRYLNAVETSKIYTFQVNENQQHLDADANTQLASLPIYFSKQSRLRREYFLIVLSPQFSSLTVAWRPSRGIKKNSIKNSTTRKPSLVAIAEFEGRIINQVVEAIDPIAAQNNLDCPSYPDAALLGKLMLKQTQRQDEINTKITKRRLIKLQQQNQNHHNILQQKDDYLNKACQELRTPLTHMKTALSLLNSPAIKPPQRQRYLQMLTAQCERQNSLIAGVLELLQLEESLKSPTFETVRLCDIVPGVVSTYQPIAQEKGIMLAYTVPTELPPVYFVSGGLKQIVINLLSNSIIFTPNGGEVWVKARLQGNNVHLEIRDTGIGIAETEISKIFDRFYSHRPPATEEPGGAGLGLTVVQQLLQRCGATISVKSKQTEGSTFTVQLSACN